MVGRGRRARERRAAPAFRPSARPGVGHTPSRTQAVALLCGLVLVATGIAVASFVVKPSKARAFELFYGSVYINDNTSPVAVDLATGKPTVRLTNAFTAVSARSGADADVYPLGGGNTLLLDPTTGEFNMVDSTGFVVKATDGGVPLPAAGASTTSTAVAAGSSAYILRAAPGSTSVYLVGAATVSAAVGSRSGARARGYATLPRPLAADRVPAAQADGSLWLLTSAGGTARRITELSVPAGSNAGVTLTATDHGTVSGPSAVESATRNADGTGGDVPAVADASAIRLFGTAGVTRLPVSAGAGVDTILPAGNAQGRAVFLYHAAQGWSLVSAAASGTGAAQVHRLTTVPAGARLVVPAQSDGRTYTMDASGPGSLWQIEPDGTAQVVPGAPTYPLVHGEQPQFGGAQVVAEGGRVIFDSRANLLAEVVFSDGTRPPRVLDKHSAVQVDPSGATALADAHATGSTHQHGKTHKPPKTVKRPTQTINDKIDCKTAEQVPRVPTLIPGDRAARSISLTWVYTRLDPSDCYPSTYVVGIKVLSSDAPSPPSGQVTVQGQNGVTLTHLFPATEYELTVTAYINAQHTTSAPVRVTTGPEGPAAPTGVRASTDSAGNWTVSWNSCGGIQQGCVPSTTWNLIPSFCDGRGMSTVPEKLTFPGDPTVHSFTHVYPGADALLGRALCFQVQGVSPQGTAGTTSATSAPAYSWTTPSAAALTLTASQPADTAFGATTTTTVDLGLGANPVRDVGGIGATITLHLTGPDGTATKTMTWDGKPDRVSAVFPGIRAGVRYTATAQVAPPNHPGSAVGLGPVTVTPRAQWPAISANASCPAQSGAITLSCTLVVQLSGPSSAAANGERFDLVDSGVVCGNSGFGLSANGIDPAHDAITQNVDLLQFNGNCTVTVHLAEAGTAGGGPLVFGGTTSPAAVTQVDLGHASTLDAGQNDFSAQWVNDQGASGVQVTYQGPRTDDQVGQLTYGWQETLFDPNGDVCGSSTQQPTHSGIVFDADGGCVNDHGDSAGWRATVTYNDKSNGAQHRYSYTLDSTPPTYTPCTVALTNFSASWASDGSANVVVGFDPTGADLRGCSAWQLTVDDPGQTDCGDSTATPDPAGITIPIKNTCTPAPGYTVSVSYRDPAHTQHDLGPVVVGGTPPTPTPTPSPTPDPPPSSTPPPS